MENASKAMIIVAGALIGVMIVSLGIILFDEMQAYVQVTNDKIDANAQNAFNTQFTNFISENLKIHDIISAANLAYENNIDYNMTPEDTTTDVDPSRLFVAVYLDGDRIDDTIPEEAADLLSNNLEKTYECLSENVKYSQATGRIYEIHFSTK